MLVDHGYGSTKRLRNILAYCLQMKFLVVGHNNVLPEISPVDLKEDFHT